MGLIGTGIDLVEIERIRRLASRDESIFVARILGPQERVAAGTGMPTRWAAYARCVAVKEAAFKALGTGLAKGMRWSDVELVYENGAPTVRVSGGSRNALLCRSVSRLLISVASTKRFAVAVVILEQVGGQEL